MMELLLELASTVALTLLLCHFVGKLVSSPASLAPKLGDGGIGLVRDCDFVVQSPTADSGAKNRTAIIEEEEEEAENRCMDEKIIDCVEFGEEDRETVGESLDVSENSGRLGEKLGEQEYLGENGGSFARERDLLDGSPERDNGAEIEECLGDEEDGDWVGIERTKLEKLFGSAMAFVGSPSNEARVSVLDNDVKTKMYGLRKIVTQGPCLEPRPMALKVSARAKWNAWQQLGEMTPEMAMEQYVSLLSDSVPGWIHHEHKKA